ncbi:MAG: MATE family efflux transporter [Gemmiger sp.]|uniref:MATE family efflux transporter n=1 Tax=Gemmiger sp. TaxID=2049027 RepID=UPI00266517B2|nr:MATE family efflux transporter [Gemmiger sp.]MEE0709384.1 MATE family efflux transporter [Gemmiger sp.]
MTNENPLGSQPLPKLLRSFAVPSILAMLVSSLYNIVDQIFIGQGVGYLGNAATNVAYPLTTICLAIALLIGIGGAANFNLNLGAGRPEAARRVVAAAVTMMVTLGLLYMVLVELFLPQLLRLFGGTDSVMPYAIQYTRITALGMPLLILTNAISNLVRADGSPRYSMTCMLLGAIINTILDPVFIFVCHWGVAGAAWATVIGQAASCAMAVAYLPRFRNIHLQREDFRPRPALWWRIASLGLSNSMNQIAITFVQIILNNSLTYYGAQSIYGSEIPLATSGIVIKINAILLGIIVGISQGTQPIISFNYGAGKYDRVCGIYRLAVRLSLIISAVGFVAFQLFPKQIVSLFGTGDHLYFEFAVKFMRTYLFMVVVNCVQLLSSNFFAAIGKPIRGLLLALTRQVFFLVPLLLILPRIWGLDGLLFAAPVADFIAFVTSALTMRAELRRLSAAKAPQPA